MLSNITFKLDEEKLKTQVNNEYQMAYSTVSRKRQIFRDQQKLFDGIVDQDKIDLKTLFYNIQAWMSTNFMDKKSVEFVSRKFWAERQADRLSKLADFDVDEMGYSVFNYTRQFNRIFRWVGITALQGWDDNRKCPVWRAIDTTSWIPDPNWYLDPKSFRFHGFDITATFAQLSQEDSFFNLDKLADDILTTIQSEGQQQITTRVFNQRSAALNPTDLVLKENPLLQLYYHYTSYYDEKWDVHKLQTCWAQDRQRLVKVQEILPVKEEEKENPELIPFPVTLQYFVPKPFDPFGVSLPDLVQDKHRYKNVLANLMFIREKDAALGDDVIFDTNIIKNPNDLTRPTLNKKFIGADWRNWPINASVAVVPKNPSAPASYNFIEFLDKSAEFATWFDARQMWLQGSWNITLGESQQLQANANLKTQYLNEIGNIGEKHFWELWLRCYHENFEDWDKKIVRVTDAFGTKNIEFTKEDFLTENDPDIKIVSEADKSAKLEQQKTQLWPVLMQMAVDPSKSEWNRKNIQSKLLEMYWVRKDEMCLYLKEIPEEIDAMNKLELINANIPEWAVIEPETFATTDHSVYIAVFKQALDSPLKYKAIEARKQAIIQNAQTQGQQPQLPWQQQTSMANMATSSLLNQWNQAPLSRTNPNQ